MEGIGRISVLGVESADPILSWVSSLGLALVAGTALVVDMTGEVRTARTLGTMRDDGPSLAELSPGAEGVAIVDGHDVDSDSAYDFIAHLARHWPSIVVRVHRESWPGPAVPVRALVPGLLAPQESIPSVWQPVGSQMRPPGPGPVLPRLGRRLVNTLLNGRVPVRSRWVNAWRRVWEMPWA